MSTKLPTPAKLRELLSYNRKTGVLTWKPRTGYRASWWNGMYAGKVAGTVLSDGHIAVKVYDQNLIAHRIIWAMVHDEWPECIVHRNGNRSDNRLSNLRNVNRKAIQRAPVIYRSNKSGVRGVIWSKVPGKWLAYIRIDDFQFHLGLFNTKEEAAKARRAAERRRDRASV